MLIRRNEIRLEEFSAYFRCDEHSMQQIFDVMKLLCVVFDVMKDLYSRIIK